MNIQHNASLLTYNTFAIDVKCKQLICVDDENDLEILFKQKNFDNPFLIIGSGSNILFTKDFDGTVIRLQTKGIQKVDETNENVFFKVAAGELWDDFVSYCIQNEYYGVENLIGIPGLVGSSPVQNIGAYGVEVKDVVYNVEGFFVHSGEKFELNNSDCKFFYRNSIFKTNLKNQCLVTNVIFRLSKKEKYNLEYKALNDFLIKNQLQMSLKNVAASVLKVRNSKLPEVGKIGSAGSFFKNPIIKRSHCESLLKDFPNLTHFEVGDEMIKLAAGQLVELSGWKGKQKGDAGVYPLQALVIVNYGKATGNEILALSKEIQSDVYKYFNVTLEPEVTII